jgi:hypothetical protein
MTSDNILPAPDSRLMQMLKSKRDILAAVRPGSATMRLLVYVALAITTASLSAQTQRFQNPSLLTTALDPAAVIPGDWNGDGHQDLIYIDESPAPTLHVLFGTGKGTFNEGASVPLPAGSCSFEDQVCRVVAADFTGDGKTDLLMGYSTTTSSGLMVLPGLGGGLFGPPILSPVTGASQVFPVAPSNAVADFDGNGTLDVALGDYSNDSVAIYSGDGQGHFTLAGSFSVVNVPAAIYSADVNHDGVPDLVVLDEEGGFGAEVEVWLGNGQLGFTNSKRYQNPSTPFFGNIVTDLNGDGNVDVVGSDNQGTLKIETGNSDGTFNNPQTIGSGLAPGGRVVSSVDLNGDGLPDLIVTDPSGFATLIAKSSLAYSTVQIRTSGVFAMIPSAADFNEDGVMDLAEGVSGGIQLFLGNRQGNFPDSTFHPAAVPLASLFTGDFNGDGVADVTGIDTNGNLQTYLGSRDAGFQTPVETRSVLTNASYIGNQTGDFDGDGKQDILLGISYNQQNPGTVLYGNGDGTFIAAPGPYTLNGVVADLNNDGKSDDVYITLGPQSPVTFTENYELVSLLGQSNRTFTQVTTDFTPHASTASDGFPAVLGVRDMNGDGIVDAVVYDPTEPALEVWLGKGDGTFREYTSTNIAQSGFSLQGVVGQSNAFVGAVGDLDGDGNADTVILAARQAADAGLNPEYILVIEYGDGKGGFAAMQVLPLTHPYTSVALATLDASGHPGLVVSDGSLIGVVRNLGSRTYSQETLDTAGSLNGVGLADFNGDGYSDILALRAGIATFPAINGFTVLLNQPAETGSGTGQVNGTVTANPNSVQGSQPFTLTATLTASAPGAPTPTGVVDFSDYSIDFGSAPLQGGVATLQVPASVTQTLLPGFLLVTASYSGDSYYASSDFAGSLQVINPVYATTTVLQLTAGGNTISSIQAASFVTFTALVSAAQPVTEGMVAFYDGSTVLGQVQLGKTFSTNLLAPGAHQLSAQYLGFAPGNFLQGTASFTPSQSAAVPLMVNAIATTASLSASSSSATAGTIVTLTATLASNAGKPIGGVTFYDGATALGTESLDANASSSFSTASLATGQHSLTAGYGANGTFASTTSVPVVVTVNAAPASQSPTATLLNAITPAAGQSGSQVAIQVTGLEGETTAAAGKVSILVDGAITATANVPAAGSLVLDLQLPAGSHAVYASYSGDIHAAPSVSPAFATTSYGAGPDFTLRAVPAQTLSTRAGSGMQMVISAVGAWNQPVSLRCISGVPQGYACNFSPANITGPGLIMVTLQPTLSAGAASLLLLPGIALLAGTRRRRWLGFLLLTTLALGLSGCGGSAPSTSLTGQVLTIQASSGGALHSAQVTVLVPAPQQ